MEHTGGRKKWFGFSKTSLKTAVNYLVENCYFNDGNVAMKQAICIPMRIDTAPFWATIFYGFMKKSLICSDKIKRFINDLCAVNDGGEFGRSICDIYPK